MATNGFSTYCTTLALPYALPSARRAPARAAECRPTRRQTDSVTAPPGRTDSRPGSHIRRPGPLRRAQGSSLQRHPETSAADPPCPRRRGDISPSSLRPPVAREQDLEARTRIALGVAEQVADRKSVVQGKSVTVRVVLGSRRNIKKKKKNT